MGPSLRSSPELITNSISCMPREPSSIGTSVRVWKKVSSPRPERILPPSRRITKRSEWRPPRVKVRKKPWSDEISIHDYSSDYYKQENFLGKKKNFFGKKKKKKKKKK